MSEIRRCTMSLPSDLVDKLDKLSAVAGISRSALVAGLLGESVDVLDAMIRVSVDPSPEGLRRFRGESVNIVNDKVASLRTLLSGDLFLTEAKESLDGDL